MGGGSKLSTRFTSTHVKTANTSQTSWPHLPHVPFGRNSDFCRQFSAVLWIYFAHSKMPLVTHGRYENFRIFWALWCVTYKLNEIVQYTTCPSGFTLTPRLRISFHHLCILSFNCSNLSSSASKIGSCPCINNELSKCRSKNISSHSQNFAKGQHINWRDWDYLGIPVHLHI
jgi:hypothetical protein